MDGSQTSNCLTPLEIEAFVARALSATDEGQALRHLEACSECRMALGQEQLYGELCSAFAATGSTGENKQRSGRHSPLISPPDSPLQEIVLADGYQVISEIHRGGQGIVYRVMQLATKRMVALKVLLAGVASSESHRQRFEREIDIAASLRHPNIVTIYDSGIHNDRQYLAMEYIDGLPLDRYMLQYQLPTAASHVAQLSQLKSRLRLFQKIADAVGYAHTRGIIHRDLKPANIIVDVEGEPHVLDFGLAKLAKPDSDNVRLGSLNQSTINGEFLGTLAYASPEQARGDPQQIDIRTDVYSLGVILFEMLTGVLPYETSGTISEALTNICELSPKRPSQLQPEVDDELETMLLKALSKEPVRRYQSAEHFCRDIGHYLANEPIDAKRDSTWYLLRKSLRRYRVALTVATSFVIVISVALMVSLASLRRAIVQRNLAIAATAAAQTARADELVQRLEAESQRKEAQRQTKAAQSQKVEAEFQSYVANMAAAAGAVRMFDVVEAVSRLKAAPEHLRGWEWEQLAQELDQSRQTLLGSSSYVTDVAISPDERWIAASGYGNSVYLWDRASASLLETISGPARASIAFSPDGNHLAIGWWNGQVRLWDIAAKAYSITLQGPANGIIQIAFSQNASRMAAAFHPTGGQPQEIVAWVWDLPEGELVQQVRRPKWHIEDLALSPDGRVLALAGFDGVSLWSIDAEATDSDNFPSGSLLHALPDQPGVEHCVAVSHDGRYIASGGDDNLVHLWDAETGEPLRQFSGHGSSVLSVKFGPEDKMLISGSRDKTIRVWDVANGEQIQVLMGHQWGVAALDVSQDGSSIVSGSWDTQVKLWDRSGHDQTIAAHSKQIAGIAFAPDGNCFATASWDQTIKLWDTSTQTEITTLRGQNSQVHCLAFAPDGRSLLSGGWNGTLKLWDVATQTELASLEGHAVSARVHAVAFAPNGKWFLSGSSDNELYLWDAEKLSRIGELSGHDDHIHSAVISHNGQWIASAGHQSVRVWDALQHSAVATFPRTMIQDDFSLAFHPNDRWLAAGSDLGTVTIWDVKQASRVRTFIGHSDEIHGVAFSPDGCRMVSAAFDNRVKIWDVKSGRELATLYGYTGHVNTLAFSPNGVYLVAGLDNGRIKIWHSTAD